jgi:hypothetical protein
MKENGGLKRVWDAVSQHVFEYDLMYLMEGKC